MKRRELGGLQASGGDAASRMENWRDETKFGTGKEFGRKHGRD